MLFVIDILLHYCSYSSTSYYYHSYSNRQCYYRYVLLLLLLLLCCYCYCYCDLLLNSISLRRHWPVVWLLHCQRYMFNAFSLIYRHPNLQSTNSNFHAQFRCPSYPSIFNFHFSLPTFNFIF